MLHIILVFGQLRRRVICMKCVTLQKPPMVVMDEVKLEMREGIFGSAWISLERRLNFK